MSLVPSQWPALLNPRERKLRRPPEPWLSVTKAVLIYICIAPALSVLAQALLVTTAALLSALADVGERHLLPRVAMDPVYGGAVFSLIGHIEPRGLAIAGPVGTALHQLAPSLFQPAALVPAGASASAVIEAGATIPARAIARITATLPLLVAAVVLARQAAAPAWVRIAAVLVQLHLLIDQAPDLALTTAQIEAAGIPFLVAALSPVGDDGQRSFFTTALHDFPSDHVAVGSALVLSLLTAGVAWTMSHAGRLKRVRVTLRRPRLPASLRISRGSALRWAAAQGGMTASLILGITVAPLGALSDSEPRFIGEDTTSAEAHAPAFGDPLAPLDVTHAGPSRVTVEGQGYRFKYLVNGQPTVIRGIGYNPWYASLDPATRQTLYDRDFGRMRAMGVNTIEGWFENQFDETTLDAAHRHGLGVIMPFELNQDYDYSDPAIRAKFLAQVTDWVQRYKNHPAVRIWAPGNENFHRLIYPTIVRGTPAPDQDQRVAAFADFYVELIDTIHALDPGHPVLYRDAEDGYLAHLRLALQRPDQARPWFMYGANSYTRRLEQVIQDWPTQGLDVPLVISEFAPTGVSHEDRARGFEWYWSVIRSNPEMVMGGVVYTWATEGPEDLDRIFGLTDRDGMPIDASVSVLGRLFRES